MRTKNFYIYAVSLLVIGIFLYCGLYAVPSADDYFYANLTRDNGLIAAQVKHYVEWSGRYAATFLISLFSLTEYNSYWLAPWICILAVTGALYYFTGSVFRDLKDKVDTKLFALSFMALFLSVTTAGFDHGVAVINEGFFWFSGAITYAGSLALYLIFAVGLINLIKSKSKLSFLLCLFLIPVIVGLNETAMFLVALTVMLTVLFYHARVGKLQLILLVLAVAICSSVVFFAPGNDVRMQTSDGGDILSALGVCVEKVVQIFFFYLVNPVVWLFAVIFRQHIQTMLEYINENISMKKLQLGGGLLVYLLYFPVAYSLNAGAPDRLIAFIGFFALLVSLIYIHSLHKLIARRVSQKVILPVIVLLSLAGGYFFLEPLRIGAVTILNGHKFYSLHSEREKYVKENVAKQVMDIKVDYIERNRLLLFEDLLPRNKNIQYARFFGAHSVRVQNVPDK